ncbi:uncharacterized protein LODBEIA_P09520 [Lodderomyces beijingensis]|uniref:Uncharacterized protein n=1 Tax=Lodderomyces beijingensis TaxID=1775926 RepID=A0ABP0ZEZ6_9ASCO
MTEVSNIHDIIQDESDDDYNPYYEDDSDSDVSYSESYASSSYDSLQYQVSAQEQWEESVKQIQSLLNFVLFPLLGKLLGRRFSKFVWRRFADWFFP